MLLQNLQRAAGSMLVDALEEAYGVEGPRALAARLGRDPSWWSRLRCGRGARFPEWASLENRLSADPRWALDPTARAALKVRYLQALAMLHGVGGPPASVAAAAPESLRATLEVGTALWQGGAYRRSLAVLECLLAALAPSLMVEPDPALTELLADCYAGQSTCHSLLGEHWAAIAAARRSEDAFGRCGSPLRRVHARHLRATACLSAGRCGDAIKELSSLGTRYMRCGRPGERVRSEQDLAVAELRAGDPGSAYRRLKRLARETDWSSIPPAHAFQNLVKLAETSLIVGRAGDARAWLARADTLARLEEHRLREHLALEYVARRLTTLRDLVCAA